MRATTRLLLAQSPAWQAKVEQLPLMAVAAAGAIDMDTWTFKDHHEAQAWAAGRTNVMPHTLKAYLNVVRRIAAEGEGQ